MPDAPNSPPLTRQMALNLALWLILVLVFLWGFSLLRSTQQRPVDLAANEQKALQIAAEYIKTHYDFDIRDRKLLLIDKGAAWDVTYEVPKDRIGGGPVVTIEKETLRVLGSYLTQ